MGYFMKNGIHSLLLNFELQSSCTYGRRHSFGDPVIIFY
jgi:hypothetical protein